jgi:hypothetical protein
MFKLGTIIGYSVLLFGTLVYGQAVSISTSAPQSAVLYAPYWRVGDGFDTTIMLNNTRPKEATVTVHVYSDKGQILGAQSFHVEPLASKSIAVKDMLSAPANESSGYLDLQFAGTPLDIAAQALIKDQIGNHWNHVFDATNRYHSTHYAGVLMGGGDLPGTSVVITNISTSRTIVGLSISEGAIRKNEQLLLPAKTQRVIPVAAYATGSGLPERRVLGISISYTGTPGDVITQGLGSLGEGGSYNIHLVDSGRLQSSRLISPVLLLPWAHTPFLALRNIGSDKSMVSIVAHYNSTNNKKQNEPQDTLLDKVELGPDVSKLVTIQNLIGILPSEAQDVGLEVTTTDSKGAPLSGATVAELLLLSDEGRQVIQATPKDPVGESFNGFSQPWDISGQTQTIIAVANPSKTSRVGLMLSLHYSGGQYSYPTTMLEPGETRHISVNDIRDRQVPGAMGQKLPKNLSSGQVLMSVPGPHDLLLAESIVSDPTQQAALTSSCTTCPPSANDFTVDPSGTIAGAVGDQIPLTPYCHLDDGSQYQVLNTYALDFEPDDSSVATVSMDQQSGSVTMNLIGAGSTTVNATSTDCVYQYNWDTGECDCNVTPLPVATPPQPQVCDFNITPGQFNAQGCSVNAPQSTASIAFSAVGGSGGNSCVIVSSGSSNSVSIGISSGSTLSLSDGSSSATCGTSGVCTLSFPTGQQANAKFGYYAEGNPAGSFTVNATLRVNTRDVTHNATIPVVCP